MIRAVSVLCGVALGLSGAILPGRYFEVMDAAITRLDPAMVKVEQHPKAHLVPGALMVAAVLYATSATLVHFANISYRLGRKVTWDNAGKKFVNDSEATRLLTRDYRKRYIV